MRSLAAPALLLLASLPTQGLAEFDRSAFMRMATSTVRIEALAADQHYNLGSGVVVAPGRVVTSCHVTASAPSIRVLYGGLRFPVKLQRADIRHDLCMLDVPDLAAAPIRLGTTRSLQLGDRVVAMGFTGGYELQFADGVVRGLHTDGGLPIIKSSTAFSSGASGGGLFDGDGRLVGILTFRLRGTDDCYFSMPVDWFLPWIGSMDGFEPTRLLDEDRPLWMDAPQFQPAFLQAAALDAAHDWEGLKALGSGWTEREPDAADAWLALGKAEFGMRRVDEAGRDLRRAVDLQPRLAEAWFALGRLYAEQHRVPELRQVHLRLDALDPTLAEQLPVSGLAAVP